MPTPKRQTSMLSAGSASASPLSPSQGTVVGIQTACIVSGAADASMRHHKSLYVAAAHKLEADATVDSGVYKEQRMTSSDIRLEFPSRDTDAVAVATSRPPRGGARRGHQYNPELYFPFHCLVNEGAGSAEDDDAAFLNELATNSSVNNNSSLATNATDGDGAFFADSSDEDAASARAPAAATDEEPQAASAPTPPPEPSVLDTYEKEGALAETLVKSMYAGINATLVAIGGSGTGKAERVFHPVDGIAARAVKAMFDRLKTAQQEDTDAFRKVNRTVAVSFYEIFTEEFSDLLSIPQRKPREPTPPPSPLIAPDTPGSPKRVHFQEEFIGFADANRVDSAAFDHNGNLVVQRFKEKAVQKYVEGQLLAPQSTGLRLRTHPELGPIVEGAQELQVLSFEDFMNVVRGGFARRLASTVKTNKFSHVVLKVTLRQAEIGAESAVSSTVHIVDTATAIRVPSSVPNTKKVLQSSTALRRLLGALSEHCAARKAPAESTRSDDVQVSGLADTVSELEARKLREQDPLLTDPFGANNSTVTPPSSPLERVRRGAGLSPALPSGAASITLLSKDSVLTSLLHESFFGNTMTIVTAHVLDPRTLEEFDANDDAAVAAAEEASSQTVSTLKLVARAGAVATRVRPNYVAVQAAASAIHAEIKKLKAQLESKHNESGGALTTAEDAELRAQMSVFEDQVSSLTSVVEEKQEEHSALEAKCMQQRAALAELNDRLDEKRRHQEQLEAFAAEIDDLVEQHRKTEARLRKERDAAEAQAAEAARAQREIDAAEQEQAEFREEAVRLAKETEEARKRNAAALFRRLIEDNRAAQELVRMEGTVKGLRAACARQHVKNEKAVRTQAQLREDISELEQVQQLTQEKLVMAEKDQSPSIADANIKNLEEVTDLTQQELRVVKHQLEMDEADLTAAKSDLSDLRLKAAETTRSLTQANGALADKRGDLQREIDALEAALAEEDARADGLAKRVQELAEEKDDSVACLEQLELDICRTTQQNAATWRECDLLQEQLLAVATEIDEMEEAIVVHAERERKHRRVYDDLCGVTSARLSFHSKTLA